MPPIANAWASAIPVVATLVGLVATLLPLLRALRAKRRRTNGSTLSSAVPPSAAG